MYEWIIKGIQSLFIFSYILNSSIAASWLVLAVIAIRFFLKKAPKWTFVALWGLVAFRLLVPVNIESALSLVPSAQIVPEEILRFEGDKLQEPAYLDVISNPNFSTNVSIELEQTVDRVQIHMMYMIFIWWMGVFVLLLYAVISYWRLYRKVNTAVRYQDNIFQSEHVGSPFVLGIIRPRIYLPFNITEQNLKHVVSHEQAHIRRKDHWWKPLGFFLLTIHWFNPLMWLAYVLLCRDIELACDEKVIKELDNEQRADYTQALVVCSVKNAMISACPIAFGEVGVKDRVKSIMNYKKPTFWILVVSILVCIVVGVCFLTNPKEKTVNIFEQYIDLTSLDWAYTPKEFSYDTTVDEIVQTIGADNVEWANLVMCHYRTLPNLLNTDEEMETAVLFYTDRDKENFHTILYHMTMDASYEKEVKELLYQQAKAYMPVPTSEGGLEVLLKEDFADVTWDGPSKKVSESKTTIDYLENSVELDVYVRDNGSMVICLAIGVSGNSERKKTEPEWTNFDNIMGLSGVCSEDEKYPPFLYNFYVMEGEKSVLIAEHGGDTPENSCFSKDLDGDGIPELICNEVYADGAQFTVVYHREGNQIYQGCADDLLDEKYDHLHYMCEYSYYLPEEGVVEIHYWLNEINGYKSKKYEIDLDKIKYWELFAELGKFSFDKNLEYYKDMTYLQYVNFYDTKAEHYHADYYIAPMQEKEWNAVFRATQFDDANAMAVLSYNDQILRLEGKLNTFLSGSLREMTVEEFIEGLTWKGIVPNYVREKGAGTIYYVGNEYLKIWIDVDDEFSSDFIMYVALNDAGNVVPEANTWIYWE